VSPPIRSWLFVPGDSERKLAKGAESGADALILDLEDSVAPARKPVAREMVPDYLSAHPQRQPRLWVRINPLDESGLADAAAVVRAAPDGLVVPKVNGPDDLLRLSHWLDALEARDGLPAGRIQLLSVATETPAAVLRLAEYATKPVPRLAALTWGQEDLPAALGATGNQDADGRFALTYRYTRSACLLAAVAAGAQPVDTLEQDFRNEAALVAACAAARREGFTGKIAIHPAQVAPINAGFRPSAEEVAFARCVVEAFAANPGIGTIGMEGRMLDMPHLRQAQRVLAMDAAFS
jgi:citrate lyase subunit beta/citryl-CoA lyase